MSWAYGRIKLRDGSTIEAGYAVTATCDENGCTDAIDRGLAYRCGGADFDQGCGHYFCAAHLYWHGDGQRCPTCNANTVDYSRCWRCHDPIECGPPAEPICAVCQDVVTEYGVTT